MAPESGQRLICLSHLLTLVCPCGPVDLKFHASTEEQLVPYELTLVCPCCPVDLGSFTPRQRSSWSVMNWSSHCCCRYGLSVVVRIGQYRQVVYRISSRY